MQNTQSFGQWFGPLIDLSGLKKKAVAMQAGIDPVSLSRILNDAQGVSKETAVALARALNELSGRDLADEQISIRLAVGLAPEGTNINQNIYELGPGAKISLMNRAFSDEEQAELAQEMELSYSIAVERMRRRKEQEKGDKTP